MTDEKIYDVHPDLSSPTAEPEVQAVEEEVQEQPLLQQDALPEPQAQSRDDHPNFRALKAERERERERAERERDRADRVEAELRRLTTIQQTQEPEERLSDEDFATGKSLSRLEKKQQQEIQRLRQEQQEFNVKMIDSMLLARYPDIRKVMSNDNISRFAQDEPEIAQGLGNIRDYESQVTATYKALKKFGTPESEVYMQPAQDNYERDRAKVIANKAKPKSLASIPHNTGDTPLARANAFAQDDSEEARMREYTKMMGFANER